MHPHGGVASDDADEQRHGYEQPVQAAIGRSVPPMALRPTVLAAMGDEPLLLQICHDGHQNPTDALPLRWS